MVRNLKDIDLFTFDWSGTVSDDRQPVFHANVALWEFYGLPKIKFEEWVTTHELTVDDWMAKRLPGLNTVGGRERVREQYRLNFNAVTQAGILPQAYPDAFATLAYLAHSGKRIAILSSHPQGNLEHEAERYNLTPYLNRIDGDCRDKNLGIRAILKSTGVNPLRTAYFGDTTHDIKAAKSAEVMSVGLTTGYHTRDQLTKARPDLLLDRLSEIRRHLE